MLRGEQARSQVATKTSPPARFGILLALLGTVVVVLGLRGTPVDRAARGKAIASAHGTGVSIPDRKVGPGSPAAVEALSLAYVPRDALAVAAFRPAALLRRPSLAPLKAALAQAGELSQFSGLSFERFEQVTVVILIDTDVSPRAWVNGRMRSSSAESEPVLAGLVYRLHEAADADALVETLLPDSAGCEYAGQPYRKGRGDEGWSAFRVGERIVVASAKEAYLRRLIVAGSNGAGQAKWTEPWKHAAGADAALLVSGPAISDALKGSDIVISEIIATLWQASSSCVISAECGDDLTVRTCFSAANPNDSGKIGAALAAAIPLTQTKLTYLRRVWSDEPGSLGVIGLFLTDVVDAQFDSIRVEQRDNAVVATATIKTDGLVQIATRFLPAVMQEIQQAGSAPSRSPQTDDDEALPDPVVKPDRAKGRSGRSRSNQELADAVATSLTSANLNRFEIDISVQNGTATLDGMVASHEQRRAATKAAAAVRGIRMVRNQLTVGDPARINAGAAPTESSDDAAASGTRCP